MQKKKMSQLYRYSRLSKYEGLTGKLPVRAGTTFVGLEIELENVVYKTDTLPSSFKTVQDGSLRNRGKEFITVPIHACYLEEELKRLFAGLKTPSLSSRCSVHTHLNMRDVTEEELYRFLLLYLIFERSLYRFSGDRWNNHFCIPLYAFPREVERLMSLLQPNADGIKYARWNKYSGLNLSPLWGGENGGKLGTVEFRQMEGTTDVERIIQWVNLIISLKISAKKFSAEYLQDALRTMNSTSEYHALAIDVFKDWADLIEKQETFKEDVERCITHTKMMCHRVGLLNN